MIKLKTAEEIQKLREGGKRHAEILQLLAQEVRPGVTTEELNSKALELISEKGDTASFLNYRPEGVRRPYPAALCVSINEVIVHGIPNVKPQNLKEGDIVTLDLGLTHEGMITDAAITVGVGVIDKDSQKLIDVCHEALLKGIEAAQAGNHIGDIGYAIERFAEENEMNIAEDLAGHGVGYNVHEDPFVPNVGNPGGAEELRPGMVLAIEPMFTLGGTKVIFDPDEYTVRTADGSRAAHFEHTILITDGKPEILTA